jgi:hypothetical protein
VESISYDSGGMVWYHLRIHLGAAFLASVDGYCRFGHGKRLDGQLHSRCLRVPAIVDSAGYGIYMFFASMCLLVRILAYFVVPEMNGRRLEDMDKLFGDTSGDGERASETCRWKGEEMERGYEAESISWV